MEEHRMDRGSLSQVPEQLSDVPHDTLDMLHSVGYCLTDDCDVLQDLL